MSFFRGAVILGSSQGINIVLTLVTRLVFARLLGEAVFGQFSAALNAVTLLSRGVSMGLAPSAQYHASQKEIPFGRMLGIVALLTLGVSLAALGILYSMPGLVAASLDGQAISIRAFWGMAPFLPLVMGCVVLGVVLVPLGKVKAFGVTQAGGMIPLLLSALLFMVWLEPLQAVVAAQITSWFYLATFMLWHLRDELKRVSYDSSAVGPIVQYALKSWPNVFLTVAVARLAVLQGMAVMTPVELSWFALAIQLAEGALAPYGAVGQLILSQSASRGDEINPLTAMLLRLSVALFAVILMIAAVLGYPLLLVAGPGYVGAYLPLLALLGVTCLRASFRTANNYLGGRGLPGAATLPLSVEVVALVGLIALLGPMLGLWGVVLACWVASLASWFILVNRARGVLGVRWNEILWPRRSDFETVFKRLKRPKAAS